MRLKHNQKKHRILTLAKQQIPHLPSSQSLILNDLHPDLDQEVDQTFLARDHSEFAPENQESFSRDKKQNFKQCKIRQLLYAKNYSPTHSDIDYMDTMENYKSYLNKSYNLQTGKKSNLPVTQKQKLRPKTIEADNFARDIETAIDQNQKKGLRIIKERIERIKTLESSYKSPERSLIKIYDKIQQIKLQEKGIKLSDSFCLISVNQYVQMSKKLSHQMGHRKDCSFQKVVCYKTAKKPLSQQAKRWFYPKAYRTERNIDPQGLIRTINLEKWNEYKNIRPKSIRPLTVSNLKLSTQSPQEQVYKSKARSPKNQNRRPLTAPSRKRNEKQRTSTNHINTINKLHTQLKQKAYDSVNRGSQGVNLITALRKKVKGVRHVEREKLDWKEFKSESERCQEIEKSTRSKTEAIFEYPWNWIKFKNGNQIHARPWKT